MVCNTRCARVHLNSNVPRVPRHLACYSIYMLAISPVQILPPMSFSTRTTLFLSLGMLHNGSAIHYLQEDALREMNACSSNLLNINAKKEKLKCFRNLIKALSTNISFFLHLSTCDPVLCDPTESVNRVKCLGIYFGSDVSFNTNLAYAAKKLRCESYV